MSVQNFRDDLKILRNSTYHKTSLKAKKGKPHFGKVLTGVPTIAFVKTSKWRKLI